jgi:hypothetical protein
LEPICVVSTPASIGTSATHFRYHPTFNWSDDMKYLFVAMAVGAVALAGATSANAAGKAGAKPGAPAAQSTDISAQHRHRHHGYRHHHWRQHYGHHRPHYRSYGYYPQHHGYYGSGPYGYYDGGRPGVTFGFGGNRW